MNLETKHNYTQLTWIFIATSICCTINHGYSFAMTVPAESLTHNVSVVFHATNNNKMDLEKKCDPTQAIEKEDIKLPKPSLSNSLLPKNHNDDVAILSGKVLDENCKPISRALVTIFQIDSKEIQSTQKSIWQINAVSKFELENEIPVYFLENDHSATYSHNNKENVQLCKNSINEQKYQLNKTKLSNLFHNEFENNSKEHNQRFGRRASNRAKEQNNINYRKKNRIPESTYKYNLEEKNTTQKLDKTSGAKNQTSQAFSITEETEEEEQKFINALEIKKDPASFDQLLTDQEEKKKTIRSRALMRTTTRVIKLQSREPKFQKRLLLNHEIDSGPSPHSISNRIADRTNQIMASNNKSSLLNSVMRTNLQSLRSSFGKQMLFKKGDQQYNTQRILLNEKISTHNDLQDENIFNKDIEVKNSISEKWQAISPQFLLNPDAILPVQRWKRYEHENEPIILKQGINSSQNESETTIVKQETSAFLKTSSKKSSKRKVPEKKEAKIINYSKIHNPNMRQIIVESDIGIEGETVDKEYIERIECDDFQEKSLNGENEKTQKKMTKTQIAKQKKYKNKIKKHQNKRARRIKRSSITNSSTKNNYKNAAKEIGNSTIENSINSQNQEKLIADTPTKEDTGKIQELFYSNVASTSITNDNGTFNFVIPQSPYVKMYLVKVQRAKHPNFYFKFLVINSVAKSDYERVNSYSQKWLKGNASDKANLIVIGNSTNGYKFSIVLPS